VAAESGAFSASEAGAATASAGAGLAGAAKSFLTPTTLKNLVTKPGAVVSMLKAIMNALKLRWPAFMGTNVLLSLGLFGKPPPPTQSHRDYILTTNSPIIRILVLPQTRPRSPSRARTQRKRRADRQ
jgi:hypothetical protein